MSGPGAWDVFRVFLRLGLTSFGGPIAHLGHFRSEFVDRRRWLDDRRFTDLVALCQFLPGPTSSQVGFAIGLDRARWRGAVAAWAGFTLPSALVMIALAYGLSQWATLAGSGVVHGLKLAAVAVVAHAVRGMAVSLCPDVSRAALALATALAVFWMPTAVGQVGALVLCGAIGWLLLPAPLPTASVEVSAGVSRAAALAALAAFAALLVALPVWAAVDPSPWARVVDGVYRAGALVFGGGHVVLPLLQTAMVDGGAVAQNDFIAGYGAVQAMPGPLFSVAAFLGAAMAGPWPRWVGGMGLMAVLFLPGLLLVVGALPFWDAVRHRPAVRAAMNGINAGVVGLLLSALVHPVGTSAIHGPADAAVAAAAFALLTWTRLSPGIVVALCAAVGVMR